MANMGIFSKNKTNEISAKLYEEGISYRDKDDAKAFEILMKAAEMENEAAEFCIARMYETGVGAPKDLDAAVSWYSDSVDDGCYVAALYLAKIYIKGYDPEFDEEETTGLLSELFEYEDADDLKKVPDLLYEVAESLCTGKSSFQGQELGLKLMKKGADLGIEDCVKYLN